MRPCENVLRKRENPTNKITIFIAIDCKTCFLYDSNQFINNVRKYSIPFAIPQNRSRVTKTYFEKIVFEKITFFQKSTFSKNMFRWKINILSLLMKIPKIYFPHGSNLFINSVREYSIPFASPQNRSRVTKQYFEKILFEKITFFEKSTFSKNLEKSTFSKKYQKIMLSQPDFVSLVEKKRNKLKKLR